MHSYNSIAPARPEPHESSTICDTTNHTRMASQNTVQQLLARNDDALIQFMTAKTEEQLGGIPPGGKILSSESTIVPSSPQTGRLASLSPQSRSGKENEIQCYHGLVEEGGRPLCSLATLDKIYENLEAYAEMLLP